MSNYARSHYSKPSGTYHKPRLNKIATLYAMFVGAGLVLSIVDGTIQIDGALITETARRLVRENEVELMKHIRRLGK